MIVFIEHKKKLIFLSYCKEDKNIFQHILDSDYGFALMPFLNKKMLKFIQNGNKFIISMIENHPIITIGFDINIDNFFTIPYDKSLKFYNYYYYFCLIYTSIINNKFDTNEFTDMISYYPLLTGNIFNRTFLLYENTLTFRAINTVG